MTATDIQDDVAVSAEERLLMEQLPTSGESRGNVTVQRALGWDTEHYFRVRNQLLDRGLVARGRGRGGTVRRHLATDSETEELLAEVTPEEIRAPVEALRAREADLYKPMRDVIEGDWARDHDADLLAVEITAAQGRRPTGGTWTRPDIVTVEVRAFTYVPGKFLELTTFEIKPAWQINVQAVYEALAHRRYATRSYVILHVPSDDNPKLTEQVDAVIEVARAHGIGVVTVMDPADFQTWDEIVEAQRVEPDPAKMDTFIALQLSADAHGRIAPRLR